MEIKVIKVGFLQTNCYILTNNNHHLIIDPGDDFAKIDSQITGVIDGIIITHYHFDHVGALNELVNKYNLKVYDFNNLIEGDNIIENFKFKMIKTPGHKSDLISLLFDNKLFCGDFIFAGAIGRTDLPDGNIIDMKNSLKKILLLDENTIIYPGHGNQTTIKNEKDNLNFFINAQ